jgi:glycogen synthase
MLLRYHLWQTVAIDLEHKLTAVVSMMLVWIHIIQGAIVYSNIVTTVSPTYALEVRSEVIVLMTFLHVNFFSYLVPLVAFYL